MKATGAEASALSQWLLLLRTVKAMAKPVLASVRSLLLLMLSLEMTKMMAMKACCAGGVVGLASVFSLPLCFPCFRQCRSYGFLCPDSLSFLFVFSFLVFFCSVSVPYGFHSNEGKERNSLCSLRFISTPSVLFSFFFCCSLFHVPIKAF